MALRRRWLLRPLSWLRLGGAIVGGGVVALLLRAIGLAAIARQLRLVGVGFGWMLGAYLAANVVYALPLGLLMPRKERPGVVSLVTSRLAAVAVNAATPFLGVGGEPVRLLWLPPAGRLGGAAALVIDRGAFLIASAFFLVVGASISALGVPLLAPWIRLVLVAVAALGLGLSLSLVAFQRGSGVTLPIARLAGRIARRHRDRLVARAVELDAHVRTLHVDRAAHFNGAVAVHFLGRCTAALEIYAGAQLVGIHTSAAGVLMLASVPLAVDLVCAIVPSQIGFHEGTVALVAHALGYDPAAGVALALLQRLRQVVFMGAGFVFLSLRPAEASPDVASTPAA